MRTNASEAGFTLVELLVASAVASLVVGLLAAATFQFVTATADGHDRLAVLRDHGNAFQWLNRDAQMAVSADATVTPSTVTLNWTDAVTGTVYQSDYAQSGDELVRTLTVDGGTPTTQAVARNLDTSGFGASLTGDLLTVSITSVKGETTQTRTESILMRAAGAPPAPPSPTYYLHNNPTPPTADTASQPDLPLDQTAPTATTLYNYDTDRDAFAGRLIVKGGSGAAETDPTKYQAWRSAALGSSLTIDGTVNVHLWSAMKNFATGKEGTVTVFLRDYNGSTHTEICNGTLAEADWSGGSSTWVLKAISFSCASYTITAGNFLEVKLIVGPTAGDHMWFAYDTTTFDSRVELP